MLKWTFALLKIARNFLDLLVEKGCETLVNF